MTKKNVTEEALNASSDAVQAATQEDVYPLVGEVIVLEENNVEQPKYTVVKGISMQQFNNVIVKANGILDNTRTVVATAVARPGTTGYSLRGGNNLTRTIMWGDVAVFSFDSVEKKVGMCIMPTKPWMVMQSKINDGSERIPYIRTPWDAKINIQSQTNNLQPPSIYEGIKRLCDVAINMAATDCLQRIAENQPSQIQENYSVAIHAAAEMADTIATRRVSNTSRGQSNSNGGEQMSSAAASLLD